MYNIIKFLLVPITMIGINISNCYSMEIDNDSKIIGKNEGVIRYSSSGLSNEGATWEQWTKRANFDLIDINGEQYNNFHIFCEEHNLVPLSNGIKCFLIDIYNLATLLIDRFASMSDDISDISRRWIDQRQKGDYEIIKHLENQNTHHEFFPLKKIYSSIRNAQKKLNPKKYSNNEINNIRINSNQEFKLMDGCYYFANQLVQLTHDIVYAINNKIEQYKELSKTKNLSNEQIYEDLKKYLIEEVTEPCYKALEKAFLYIVSGKSDESLIIDNITLNIKDDKMKYDFFKDLEHNFNLAKVKSNLVYNFSNLGKDVYNKSKEFIDMLSNGVTTIQKNIQNSSTEYMNTSLLTTNSSSGFECEFNADSYKRCTLKYIQKNGPIVIYLINNQEVTTNKEIIDDINIWYLKSMKDSGNAMFCSEHTKWFLLYPLDKDKIADIIFNRENYKHEIKVNSLEELLLPKKVEITNYKSEINHLKETLDNFDLRIPNKDYMSEIKELLQKY